ncbi:hydrolase [Actinomycetota bacterium]|nr:hydrolase [Actinomycetota bacterium]
MEAVKVQVPVEESYITPKAAKALLKRAKAEDKQREALQRRRRRGQTAPKSVQDKIRYEAMFEDGLCQINQTEFSSTLRFSDINYQNLNYEDQLKIFERWYETLNYFDHLTSVQMSIYSRRATETEINDIFFDMCAHDDGLNVNRKEFNEMLSGISRCGRSSRVLEHYITFKVKDSGIDSARDKLKRIETDVSEALANMGSIGKHLNGIERLELLNNTFWPNEPFIFSYDALLKNSLRTKDAIAPMALSIPKKPKYILEYGDTVAICLALYSTGYPSDLTDRILAEIGLLDVDMIINFHLTPWESEKANSVVNATLTSMDAERHGLRSKAIKNGYDPDEMVPLELRDRIADAEQLRQDLRSRNQKLFTGTLLIYLCADSLEKLQLAKSHVTDAANRLLYRLVPIELADPLIDALNSSLPLGKNYTSAIRTLTTITAGTFMPFNVLQLQQPGGFYYGTERKSGGWIQLYRLNLKAPHAMYIGASGSGKSFAVKREGVQIRMKYPDAQILISDPDNEYRDFIEMLGGVYINISPSSTDKINPLDIARDETGRFDIAKKAQFIMGLLEEIYPAEPKELSQMRSMVDRCVSEIYKDFLLRDGQIAPPTLTDLRFAIQRQPESHITEPLSLALEVYSQGSMAQFSEQTNVDFSNRLIGFGLRESGIIYKGTAQHILNDIMRTQMMINYHCGEATYLYFDEFQTSLNSETQSEYFLDIWSRGRKFNGVCTAITQSPDTILDHPQASKALQNTPFVAMFDIPDPTGLAEIFGMSKTQKSYILNPAKGHGLYRIEGALIPFADDFPRDTNLYRVMTTKPDEAKR